MRRVPVPKIPWAFALLLLLALARNALATPSPGPAPLRPLDERTLGIGESHNYFFPMKKGEYLRIDVEQNDDIDAGIRLYDTRGKLLFHANSYTDTHGAETLSWISEKDQVVRAQVYAWGDSSGKLSAFVDGPRLPTQYDKTRTLATLSLFDGIRLQEINRQESAARHYSTSLSLWQTLKEPRWTAITQRSLGRLLYDQGKRRRSALYFSEAWPELVSHGEGLFILEAAVIITRHLEDAGFSESTDQYFSTAVQVATDVNPVYSASYTSDLATVAERTGHLEYAAVFSRLTVSALKASKTTKDLPDALSAQSRLLRRLGRFDEARRTASLLSSMANTPEHSAQAAVALGMASIVTDQPEEAVRILKASLDSPIEGPLKADLNSYLGRALLDLGRPLEALIHLRIAVSADVGQRKAVDLGLLALAELSNGNTDRASLALNEARRFLGKSAPDENAFLLRVAAEISRKKGNFDAALRDLLRALEEISSQLQSSNTSTLAVSYWSTKIGYVELATNILVEAYERDHEVSFLEKAFLVSEESRAPLLVSRIADASSEKIRHLPRLSRLGLKRIDDLLVELLHKRPAGWRHESARLNKQRSELIFDSLLTESLLQRKADRQKARKTKPPTLRLLQAQLEPDDIFLSFQLGRAGSYVWIVRQQSLELAALPPRKAIESAALETVRIINAHALSPDGGHDDHIGLELSQLILAPIKDKLVGRRLILSLDGALHQIPFSALPDPAEPGKQIIDRFEISIVPSLTALLKIRQKPHTCSGALVSRSLDPATRSSLDLEGVLQLGLATTQEINNKASIFAGALDSGCILHFATHGTIDESWPDTAALIIESASLNQSLDDRLYAFEIESLSLSSSLVVLAACASGRGDLRGEGLYGLPRAFLAAGARSVVASLWAIDGQASGELMKLFYEGLAKGYRASTALRYAQQLFRARPGRSRKTLWSGFYLVGDPSTSV